MLTNAAWVGNRTVSSRTRCGRGSAPTTLIAALANKPMQQTARLVLNGRSLIPISGGVWQIAPLRESDWKEWYRERKRGHGQHQSRGCAALAQRVRRRSGGPRQHGLGFPGIGLLPFDGVAGPCQKRWKGYLQPCGLESWRAAVLPSTDYSLVFILTT